MMAQLVRLLKGLTRNSTLTKAVFMRLRALGVSGGIDAQSRTTSLLLDDDILIDAGTGVGDLTLAELLRINHVFLTHSHLDHHAALPFLLDTVGAGRAAPVTVYAQEPTLAALRAHVFNNVIWPDFSRIPTPLRPFMAYETLPAGGEKVLGSRRIRSVPVTHAVPAVGYLVSGGTGSLAFSGDTAETDEFWRTLNACADLRHVIVETSFLDVDEDLARVSCHLCPKTVGRELAKLTSRPQIHITHLMPGREDEIMVEVRGHAADRTPRRLMRGAVIEF
jgi:ribonuclease BN (tRNA processing enzyme)